jgi:hypothetical protein
MYGKFLKEFDLIDCMIITFDVKKCVFFTRGQTGSTNFEFSWLQIFISKLLRFLMLLQKIELNIH